MSSPVTIVGSYISPYVRKVLAVLHLKDIACEIDPIVPFEKASLSVPPPQQRTALETAGAPLCALTFGTEAAPRRGIMAI